MLGPNAMDAHDFRKLASPILQRFGHRSEHVRRKLASYLEYVERAKVQDELDGKALEMGLTTTPVPKHRSLSSASRGDALGSLTPASTGVGQTRPMAPAIEQLTSLLAGRAPMETPAAFDRINGVGDDVQRECDTFGGPPPRPPADSSPPKHEISQWLNHKGVVETLSLIGEDVEATFEIARGTKPPPMMRDTKDNRAKNRFVSLEVETPARPSTGTNTGTSTGKSTNKSTDKSTDYYSEYFKDKQEENDFWILRKYFKHEVIALDTKIEEFIMLALMLLGSHDAARLERDEPEVFAAFQGRLASLRAQHDRATGTPSGPSSTCGTSRRSIPSVTCSSTGTSNDEQDEQDMLTLQELFNDWEIGYEYNELDGYDAKKFVRLAMVKLKKMDHHELEYIEDNDPYMFDVFVRRGGLNRRDDVTVLRATGTASSSRSSRSTLGSTSGSSGGSSSRAMS